MVALHKGGTTEQGEQVNTSEKVHTHTDDMEDQYLLPDTLMTVHFGTIFDRTKSGTCTDQQKSAGIGGNPGRISGVGCKNGTGQKSFNKVHWWCRPRVEETFFYLWHSDE